MSITTIIRVSIVLVIQITEFENVGSAQRQVSNSKSSITPQRKAAMYSLNNPKLKFVNFTESKIRDITPTPTNNISSEYYRKSNKDRSRDPIA